MAESRITGVSSNNVSLSMMLDGEFEPEETSKEETQFEIEDHDHVPPGMCVECEGTSLPSRFIYTAYKILDQPSEIRCISCEDEYCQVCFDSQHRKGNRKRH